MQPFEGYRVLDLTHVLAGPFCAYQLGVLGAEVIKIEPPDNPDMVRFMGADNEMNAKGLGSNHLSQNSNKKAITLNLKTTQGQDILKKLVAKSDVLVENYRAGAMAKIGLGYDELSAINPGLIYCSITGFGQTGPKREHTAFDNVIQAFSGLMGATGSKDSGPILVGPPVLDYGTGGQAAFAVSASLLRRERTGKGQYIDVSMLDSALMLMSQSVVYTQVKDSPPARNGNGSAGVLAYGCFETGNGQLMLGVHTTRQHERLWRVLGFDDLADTIRILGIRDIAARCEQDRPLLIKALMGKSADEWEINFNEAGVPAARVRTIDEALCHPQMEDRDVLQDLPTDPDHDYDIKSTTAAFTVAEDGARIVKKSPKLGEHNSEILGELGFDENEIENLRSCKII